jgi:hypothetical protein
MFALYSPVDIQYPVKDVETISSMTCPHCSISIHEAFAETNQFAENALAKANVSPQHQAMYRHSRHMRCPECGNSVIFWNVIYIRGPSTSPNSWHILPAGLVQCTPMCPIRTGKILLRLV